MDVQSKVTLDSWAKISVEHQKQYKNFLAKADKKEVLKVIPDLHEKAFEKIDCLKCARCCKGYSPRFKGPDIKRISKVKGMKESAFIEKYLAYDDEGDYVAVSTPCPFLETDNKCSVYEDRPSDCRRFPYTDEDVILKRPQLTMKNSSFCPIVVSVMEGLLEKLT
ncbi:MAG TPA: YkgJ family cysteine cluster protein [Puia sp.]|nr:YkgJ family cysteine cluster protein [Puia sp.]